VKLHVIYVRTQQPRGQVLPLARAALLRAGWQQLFTSRPFPAANLQHTAQGQPYLPGEDFHFSFSHADGLSVMACGPKGRIGADLAHLQDAALAAQLDASFFTPSEHLALTQERHTRLRLWTRKEAVLKAAGSGLLIDPGQVEVVSESSRVLGREYLLYSTILMSQYELSLAVDLIHLALEPIELEYTKIQENTFKRS